MTEIDGWTGGLARAWIVGQTKRLMYGKIYSQRFTTGWTVRRSNPDGDEVSALVLAGPGAQPASYAVGTGPFPGVKRGSGHGINRPPRSSAEVKYRTHFSTYKTAYTYACKTYYTITVYTSVILKMNTRVRNMWKTSKIKN
jgi:hypothetical protein